MYAGITIDHWAQMLSALTGWQVDELDLLKIGERVFNIREGFTAGDDSLPERVISVPKFGKYSEQPKCVTLNYQDMLHDYYKYRGWDPITGVPNKTKLVELDLS